MNTEIKLTEELTEEEISLYEDKAVDLAKQHNISKVYPVVQIDPITFERKVCYLKEPNYPTKLSVMDKALTIGVYHAADELREISVIKEASDSITYGESSECDKYKLGVVDFCLGIITRLQNQFKKK